LKKWVCDKCGKEFDTEFKKDGSLVLWEIRYNEWDKPIAEVCDACRVELDKALNRFFGKPVIDVGTFIGDK